MFKRGELGEDSYRKFQREIIATEGQLKSFKFQLDKVNSASGPTNLKEAFTGLEAKLDKVNKKLKDFSDGYNKYITKPMIAGGTVASKFAMDMEDVVAKVSTLADSTVMSNSDIEKSIMELSNTYGISTTEIGQAMYDSLSAGVDTAEVVGFVDKAVKGAEGSFSSLSSVIDGATTVLNAYKDDSFTMEQVMDMFTLTMNKGKITVEGLTSNIGKVIPSAKEASINIDNLSTGYAIMTRNGASATDATTWLGSTIDEMASSGSKSDKVLRELTGKGLKGLIEEGRSLGDVIQILDDEAKASGKALGDMFSSKTAQKGAVSMLGEGVDSFNSQLKEMRETAGVVEEQYKKTNTSSRELKQATAQLKNEFTSLGKELIPVIQAISNVIKTIASGLRSLDDESKARIMNIGKILVSLGVFLTVLTKVIGVVSTIMGVLAKLTPILEFLGTLVATVTGVIAGLNPVVLTVVAVITVLIGILVALSGGFKNAWENAKNFGNNVINSITNMVTIVTSKFDTLKDKLRNLFNVDFKLPKFNIEGSFGINPPRVPKLSVNWNAEGGIFNRPTIFDTRAGLQGVGEAGPEAIIPLKRLPDMFNRIYGSDSGVGGGSYKVDVNISGEGSQYLSIPRVAREVEKNIGQGIRHDSRRLGTKPRKIQL